MVLLHLLWRSTLPISTARDTCADLLWTLCCVGAACWACDHGCVKCGACSQSDLSVSPGSTTYQMCEPLWVHVCVYVSVAQLCLTLCDPMDCSPPGSSVHGVLQARILEWIAISFSRRALLQFRAEKPASQPRDRTWVFCIAGGFFTVWVTREAPWDNRRGKMPIPSSQFCYKS